MILDYLFLKYEGRRAGMRWGKGYKNLPSKSPVLLELLLLFHIQEASLITAIYPTKLSDFLL